jgi:GT2 family glycosyltransferase
MLTVGVPVYNGERFLERCLQNLCDEELDYRVVISDNASDDGTQEIARDFASRDARLQYIRHAESVGGVRNFSSLIDVVESEFFAWRAYDDLGSPGYFTQLVNRLEERPECTLAVGGLRYEDSDGHPPSPRMVPSHLPDDPDERRRVLFRVMAPSWMYGVFRRNELRRRFHDVVEAYPYGWAIDTALLMPFLLSGKITTVPDVHFTQWLSGASAQRYRPTGVIEPIRMVRQFCRYGFRCADEIADDRRTRWKMRREVISYANGSAEKFDRIAKRAIFWPYYKVAGRL